VNTAHEGFRNGVKHILQSGAPPRGGKRPRLESGSGAGAEDEEARKAREAAEAARAAAEKRAFGARAAGRLKEMEDAETVSLGHRMSGRGVLVTMDYLLQFYKVMEALADIRPQPKAGGISSTPGYPVFDTYKAFVTSAQKGDYGPEMRALLEDKSLPLVSDQMYVNKHLRAWMHRNREALTAVARERPDWLMLDHAALPFAKSAEARSGAPSRGVGPAACG